MSRRNGSLFIILLLVIIAVMLFIRQAQGITGIGGPTPEFINTPPDFVGWVLKVDPRSGQIKVESQADKIIRPVIVKLTKDTVIFRRKKGAFRQVELSEVHLQDQAELWLIGPFPSSFPADVNVRQIVVENLF